MLGDNLSKDELKFLDLEAQDKTKCISVFSARRNLTPMRFAITRRMIVIAIFFTILLDFRAEFASAQTYNFNQTG